MSAFCVLDGGLQTLVQDAGRPGLLALGVPRSGVLDTLSFDLANRLVANPAGAAVLEFRSPGPALRLEAPAARITLTGTAGPLLIERDGATQEWPAWRAVDLREGDIVRIAPFADTAIGYLAVAGGIDVPEHFGSRATFLRGGFGGVNGRALKTGDRLALVRSIPPDSPCLTLLTPPRFATAATLRALAGPQASRFAPAALKAFFSGEFRVTRDLDRMGVRLEGPRIAHADPADIVSDATVPGAVQVPGSSQPILLLNDSQTTGGYPKIAIVISSDLPIAGRLLPGATVRFRQVEMAEAEEARTEARHHLDRLLKGLVAVRSL